MNREPRTEQQTRTRRIAAALALTCAGVTAGTSACAEAPSCDTFIVVSQNRWQPYGTAIRIAPSIDAEKLPAVFNGNDLVAVDGYVHSGTINYPTNQPPFNTDIWYRLADADGWVSYEGVRGEATQQDPTGYESGGLPAPLPGNCETTYMP